MSEQEPKKNQAPTVESVEPVVETPNPADTATAVPEPVENQAAIMGVDESAENAPSDALDAPNEPPSVVEQSHPSPSGQIGSSEGSGDDLATHDSPDAGQASMVSSASAEQERESDDTGASTAEANASTGDLSAQPTARKPTTAPGGKSDARQRPGSRHRQPLQHSFSGRTTKVGDLVSGKVVKITGSVAFIDYGARSEGYIELSELRTADGEVTHQVGDAIRGVVVSNRGAVQLSYRKAQATEVIDELKTAWRSQTAVEGQIVALNKGGFEVRVQGVRAFCPSSQISDRYLTEPAREVGKTYEFRITEFGDGRSLVVSRRALLEQTRARVKEVIGESLKVGDRIQGTVTQLRDFGVFIDIGQDIEGLCHVSELSHKRVDKPAEVVNVGDAVEVEVIRIEADKGRVALSMKSLTEDPWSTFTKSLEKGTALSGTVVRMQSFGAFVNLAPGIDGLLHVSGITTERRIEHPEEVLSLGEEVAVVVDKIEHERKRIGLLTPSVAEARKPIDMKSKKGDEVKGKVTRIERFGVFVEIEPGVVGLVPNVEMGTERGADHMKLFPVGTEFDVKIIEVDKVKKRIRLSRKALLVDDEEVAYREYRKSQKGQDESGSLGSFGDLLKDYLDKS